MTNASMWKVMSVSFVITLALLFLARATIFARESLAEPLGNASHSVLLPRTALGF